MKKIIMLDLDGTIKTDVDWKSDGKHESYISKKTGKEYKYKIRPNVKEFVEGLKEMWSVSILTLSSQPYAEYFVERMGIEGIIDEVYSRDRFDDIPMVSNYLLIENDFSIAKGKQCLLEKGLVFEKKTIIISTYEGNEDDKELIKLLERIKLEKQYEGYKK